MNMVITQKGHIKVITISEERYSYLPTSLCSIGNKKQTLKTF